MKTYLDFEKPIAELEGKIRELEHAADDEGKVDIGRRLPPWKPRFPSC